MLSEFVIFCNKFIMNSIFVLHSSYFCSYTYSFFLCFFVQSESVTEVRTNIYVTSFGPVSDTDMVCAFLYRLKFLYRLGSPEFFFLCIFIRNCHFCLCQYFPVPPMYWFWYDVLCLKQMWLHVIGGRLLHEKTEMFSLLLKMILSNVP